MHAITFQPLQRMSPADLLAFSQLNRDLQCELNANGTVMLRTSFHLRYTSLTNKIVKKLEVWNSESAQGTVLTNKTGFVLRNGAIRHPAIAWVKTIKMAKQIEHLIEHVPDFFIEYLTASESLSVARGRMQEYLNNGAHLGWLIDLENETIYIFQENKATETILGFKEPLSGGEILKGFQLTLSQ
ncbi:MAG: Uma2 family endonuclease [Saprospiraceae bacterium]|nr:Uma2 family endonuclease [Saprospiraceae bacterium]